MAVVCSAVQGAEDIEEGPASGSHARHYAAHHDAADQTSPSVVATALAEALDRHRFAEPVVDVGTGIGTNLATLTQRFEALGTDVAHHPLVQAAGHGPVAVADGAFLPFRDGAFGSAVCTEVLEHVDDPAVMLEEMARVLRPGGFAFVSTPNYANLAGVHKWWADRRSGRHDWNPWGAHEGGFEAFMTGRRLRRAALPSFEIVSVRALDYGQALTGRFAWLDRVATTRAGQAALRRLLPRFHRPDRRVLSWHGMHIALVLRRPLAPQ